MRNPFLKATLPFVFVLALASCSSDKPEDSITNVPQTEIVQNYNYNADELELMEQINQYRESIGKHPLQTINHISYKSEEHTEYMIAMNAINHDNFDERSQNLVDVLGATKVSENVAYNYATPEAVLHAWLESDGHKKNIEGEYTHFGVSVKTNPANGNKYYTNIFIKK
ncbi:CAP domain-containing protein [Flavobacterium sp.]|uniref:CAP domain-containing protein n=1 Tax=Flavobacterium sp. TaxID=239 RepID=UPI0039E6A366